LVQRGIDAPNEDFASGERKPARTAAVWTGTTTDGSSNDLDSGG
jgi:hypothetical protein